MKGIYTRRSIQLLTAILASMLLSSCASDRILRQQLANCPSATDRKFDQALEEWTEITLVNGNRITELVNGEQFFPAMIDAISAAEKSVEFENFVWRSGKISTRFIDVLTERARAGVKVRFIVDAMGARKLTRSDLAKLDEAGVEVVKYNPLTLMKFFSVNHRTHRKTLVVDGKIGFLGGISIADEWFYESDKQGRWRDSNYLVEGPMAAQLQKIFAVNWAQSTGQEIEPADVVKTVGAADSCEAACFMSGPGEGDENARLLYLFSIAGARKSIRIAHSYLLPGNLAKQLLIDARKRGVKIEVLIPGNANLNFVRRASRSRWRKLLDAGVEFYEYQPAKYHLKLMIVDDVWVTAGSINFDERSFRINDEANFVARDEEFAATQIATFVADKLLSRRVDPEEFSRRPWRIKLLEHFFGLFRFQL